MISRRFFLKVLTAIGLTPAAACYSGFKKRAKKPQMPVTKAEESPPEDEIGRILKGVARHMAQLEAKAFYNVA